MLIHICLALLFVYFCYALKRYNRKNVTPKGYKDIPYVQESYVPFFGNGLGFSKDIIGYIRNAHKKYGGIFRLKLFRKEMVVVCDRNLVKDYFAAREDTLSMYNVLEDLFLRDAFAGKQNTSFSTIITLIKKTITVKYDEFGPKIIDEANKLALRMQTTWCGKEIDLTELVIKFIANTSARCFVAIELTDEFYPIFIKFTHLLNWMIVTTYFLPMWFLRLTAGHLLKHYWHQMVKQLVPEVQKYRDDPTKKDSLVLRASVDYVEDAGTKLNDEQIGGIVVGLLYISSENSAIGLASTIIDLVRNPEHWDRVKDTCQKYLDTNDINGLFNDPYLDACVTETCRMGAHIFAINRKPASANMELNGYYLGNIDTIAICQPMLMTYDCAGDVYKNAETYNPDRFLGEHKESKLSHNLLTFGSGSHLCPGKNFAILEIKAALAMITTQFERFKLPNPLPDLFYFSPSAFAERFVKIKINPLPKIETKTKQTIKDVPQVRIGDKMCVVEKILDNGWILRNYLSREEQIKMYSGVTMASKNSASYEKVIQNVLYPITYYNSVDHTSNCECPTELLAWGQNIWNNINGTLMEKIDLPQFNSVTAELYNIDTVDENHHNEILTYGMMTTLGSSHKFSFDSQDIELNSGDILITDFRKVLHGIKCVLNNPPGWLNDGVCVIDDIEYPIKTFDRSGLIMHIGCVA
uniref:Cytochrome P450 n=1 Tax=viral metagenome TaxID=1070528 RepID=A0A6C0C9Q3_9ZZZZ